MTKLNSRSRLAAFALILLAAAPAQALVNRAWVSGHGADDAGCGAPTSPCRSFQYVHDNIIAAGGEIDVLDPAGYGAVRITKALSIVNDGVGTAGTQTSSPGQDGIDINTGPNDLVLLKGLTVDGVGTGGVGINLQSASRLVVIDCTIEGFGAADPYGVGIAIAPGTASGTGSNSRFQTPRSSTTPSLGYSSPRTSTLPARPARPARSRTLWRAIT